MRHHASWSLAADIVLNGFRKVSDISRKVFVALAVGSCVHDEDLPVPPCDRQGVRLFCNLVTFSCTDRNYATDASKPFRFGDITKYMCSKHSAKFGVSSLKNEVTGYFFIMGKSLCRTLYIVLRSHTLYVRYTSMY